jgi:hypothetical protein
MTISVSINGYRTFDWEGSAADAGRMDEDVRDWAREAGMTPAQVAQTAVAHVLERVDRGFVPDDMGLIHIFTWMLLSQPTGHPEQPGCYRDYIDTWDFNFDVQDHPDQTTLKISVEGRMQGRDEHGWLN